MLKINLKNNKIIVDKVLVEYYNKIIETHKHLKGERMNVKLLKKYIAFCEVIHVTPSFVGLKAYKHTHKGGK